MCHFIFAALPEKSDIEYISEIFIRHGRKFELSERNIDGPSIPDNLNLFDTCKESCDCGTPIGSRTNTRERKSPDTHEINQLKRKGWSQTKINRWIESKENSLIEKGRKRISDEQETAGYIDYWVTLIREVVSSKKCNRLGLMLFWAPKAHNHLKKKVTITLSELSPNTLREMEENVLYDFIAVK